MSSQNLRFDDFEPSSEKSSKIASKIKSSNTKVEIILRKILHNEQLKELDWTVIRFWESDILKNPNLVAIEITSIVTSKRIKEN